MESFCKGSGNLGEVFCPLATPMWSIYSQRLIYICRKQAKSGSDIVISCSGEAVFMSPSVPRDLFVSFYPPRHAFLISRHPRGTFPPQHEVSVPVNCLLFSEASLFLPEASDTLWLCLRRRAARFVRASIPSAAVLSAGRRLLAAAREQAQAPSPPPLPA